MIKIRNLKEYYKLENQLPPIICSSIMGDLLMIERSCDEAFYNKDEVDKYGPLVVVLTREEYNGISTHIPSITKENYEYKEIVGIDDNSYYIKLLYLFNNGESGIIVYVLVHFNNVKRRFNGCTYTTRGINEKITNEVLGILIKLIEISRVELNDNLDYLQVFEIKQIGTEDEPILMVHHKQEKPGYSKVLYYPGISCDKCKIFWISEYDEEGYEHSTIMLAEEY